MNATIFQAQVVTGNDPLGLGRVKVLIPQVSGAAVSTWAAPTARTYGPPPAPGSTVWVSFDTGDASKPVYHAAATYSPWTPIPAAWMTAGWNAYTGAYRLTPGGGVEFRGEVNTTTSPVNGGATVLSLPASLQPKQQPASIPVAVLVVDANGSTDAVARVDSAIRLYGGNWTFSGTFFFSLFSLRYTTI